MFRTSFPAVRASSPAPLPSSLRARSLRRLRDAAISGSAASVLSTLALLWFGRRERGSAVNPTNAISHWVWGDGALTARDPSARHTLVGYAIHHCASVFWALFYEGLCHPREPDRGLARRAGDAAAIATAAYVVDTRFTPHRLTPGFERRLSGRALAGVYAAFAIGLVIGVACLPASGRPGARRGRA